MTPHRFSYRVYYEDTDLGGIVYHANYLKFAERARTEFFRECGVYQGALRKERGIAFVVRRIEVDLLKPAQMDDMIAVETSVEKRSGASFTLSQIIFRGTETIAQLLVHIVCVNADLRPIKIPADIKESF